MAVQQQTPVPPTESPPTAIGQTNVVQSGGDAIQPDDRPGRSEGLMERFLNYLRIVLSVPHI
jgi:hypothetical protein